MNVCYNSSLSLFSFPCYYPGPAKDHKHKEYSSIKLGFRRLIDARAGPV